MGRLIAVSQNLLFALSSVELSPATLITVNNSKVACSKAKKEILKMIKEMDKETALMNRMSRFCEHEDARSLIGSLIPPTLQQGMQVSQMWVNFETSTTVPPKVTASIYTLLQTRDESVDAGVAAQVGFSAKEGNRFRHVLIPRAKSSSYARLSSRPTRPIAFKIELELQKGTMDWLVMPASRATAWSTTETRKPSWIRL